MARRGTRSRHPSSCRAAAPPRAIAGSRTRTPTRTCAPARRRRARRSTTTRTCGRAHRSSSEHVGRRGPRGSTAGGRSDASAARVDDFTGQGKELDRRVHVRPTAAGARTAPRRRRCHLRQERRVADHHVEPPPGEVVRERVGVDDVRAGTADPRRSRRGRIDVDSDEFARDARGVDTLLDGGEEASVTARRIEDPQRPARARPGSYELGRRHLVDHCRHQIVGRVPGAEPLAGARHGTPRQVLDTAATLARWRVVADGPRRPWCARHTRV